MKRSFVLLWLGVTAVPRFDPPPPADIWPPTPNSWIELKTSKFSLRTAAQETAAAALLRAMEDDVLTTADVAFLAQSTRSARVTVIHFGDSRSLAGGVCGTARERELTWNGSDGTLCFVGAEPPLKKLRDADLFHFFLRWNHSPPYWLKAAIAAHLVHAEREGNRWVAPRVRAAHAMNAPLLAALLDVKDSSGLTSRENASAFQAMSEGLLQTFLDDADLRPRLQVLLRMAIAGEPDAWKQAMDGVSNDKLVEAFRANAVKPEPLVVEVTQRSEPPFAARTLSDDELRFMKARLTNDVQAAQTLSKSSDANVAREVALWMSQRNGAGDDSEKADKPPARISGELDPRISLTKLGLLRHTKGIILVKIMIGPSGAVERATILKSTIPLLNDEVVHEIETSWKFAAPGKKVTYLQPYTFTFN